MSTPITEERTFERIKNSNEIFTPEDSVEQLLDEIEKKQPELFTDWSNTILEPTCGNGRFLVGIIKRRLKYMDVNGSPNNKFNIKKLLKTIYGMDIHPSNVEESRKCIIELIKVYCSEKNINYWKKHGKTPILDILKTHIVCGDSAKILGNKEYYEKYDFDIIQEDPFEFPMEKKIDEIMFKRPDLMS